MFRTVQQWNMLPLEITNFLTLKSIQDTSVWPSVRDSVEGIPVLFRSDHMSSKAPSHSRICYSYQHYSPTRKDLIYLLKLSDLK